MGMMHLAVVLEQFCGKLGLRVPKDLSIVSFNNSLFSRITNPQLTTVGGHFMVYRLRAVKAFRGRRSGVPAGRALRAARCLQNPAYR